MRRQRLVLQAWALLVFGLAIRAFANGMLPGDPRSEPRVLPCTIDVNRASAAELQALPGIGAARAEAIVLARIRRGPFRDAEDLARVDGLGLGTIAALVPLLTFGSRALAAPAPPRPR